MTMFVVCLLFFLFAWFDIKNSGGIFSVSIMAALRVQNRNVAS